MTTSYHYKGERRQKRSDAAHWRRTFGPWLHEQLRIIEEKRFRRESFTESEVAILKSVRAMERAQQAAA